MRARSYGCQAFSRIDLSWPKWPPACTFDHRTSLSSGTVELQVGTSSGFEVSGPVQCAGDGVLEQGLLTTVGVSPAVEAEAPTDEPCLHLRLSPSFRRAALQGWTSPSVLPSPESALQHLDLQVWGQI